MSTRITSKTLTILASQILFVGFSRAEDIKAEYQRQKLEKISAMKIMMKRHTGLHTDLMIAEECIKHGHDKHSLRNRIVLELDNLHRVDEGRTEQLSFGWAKKSFARLKDEIAMDHDKVCSELKDIPDK